MQIVQGDPVEPDYFKSLKRMICLYNVEGMLRKTIMILVCVGCCVAASAQTDIRKFGKGI